MLYYTYMYTKNVHIYTYERFNVELFYWKNQTRHIFVFAQKWKDADIICCIAWYVIVEISINLNLNVKQTFHDCRFSFCPKDVSICDVEGISVNY